MGYRVSWIVSKDIYAAGPKECSEVQVWTKERMRGQQFLSAQGNLRMTSSAAFKGPFLKLGCNLYLNNMVCILNPTFTLSAKGGDWHSGLVNTCIDTKSAFLDWLFFIYQIITKEKKYLDHTQGWQCIWKCKFSPFLEDSLAVSMKDISFNVTF